MGAVRLPKILVLTIDDPLPSQDSKFRLILIESRIHRLARYYRLAKKLPGNWRYESATASALVA